MTRCGVAAIIGAPNAGKSTLVNALVGAKVAIVSPKVQTTRSRLTGIAMAGDAQLLLIDTPGIFSAGSRLDRAMVKAAWSGADGADVVLLMVDARAGIREETDAIVEALKARREPLWLVLNKSDISKKEQLLVLTKMLHERLTFAQTFMISAHTGDGVADLKRALADAMPEAPWHYPEDQISDLSLRLMASEITREQIFVQLHQELPYASAVETEKWEQRKDGSAMIHQVIHIERDSQKGIMLGKGGQQLRAIGEAARLAMADAFGHKVHLQLFVRVSPNWSEDRGLYAELGLDWRV